MEIISIDETSINFTERRMFHWGPKGQYLTTRENPQRVVNITAIIAVSQYRIHGIKFIKGGCGRFSFFKFLKDLVEHNTKFGNDKWVEEVRFVWDNVATH